MEDSWNSYQANSDTALEAEKLSHEIGSNVQRISQNVTAIERMVSQLGTAQDNEQLRAKLHDQEHETKTLSQKTAELLTQFSNLMQSGTAASVDEQRKMKLVRERLAKEFAAVLNNFQSVQRRTAQKEKAGVARAKYDQASSDKAFGSAVEEFPPQQRQVQIEAIDVHTLKERQEAIAQLEADISDVNQIFKDLALMVHDQGEMLDSIEANVDNAQIRVEQGHAQIAKAAEYQRKARRKRCICMLVLAVLAVVLILILSIVLKH